MDEETQDALWSITAHFAEAPVAGDARRGADDSLHARGLHCLDDLVQRGLGLRAQVHAQHPATAALETASATMTPRVPALTARPVRKPSLSAYPAASSQCRPQRSP